MKHLQSFIARSISREFDCIYLNIDLAAFYLSHLLAVSFYLLSRTSLILVQRDIMILKNRCVGLTYLHRTITDLWDTRNAPEELSATLERNGLHLNGIKTPLHLALTVSPLCLLLPINFSRNLYGRPKMLQVSLTLGIDFRLTHS